MPKLETLEERKAALEHHFQEHDEIRMLVIYLAKREGITPREFMDKLMAEIDLDIARTQSDRT